MADAVGVQVVEAHEDLLEIVAANLRAEGTGVGDEVEQLAAGNELLRDVGDLGLSAVLVSVHRVWLDGVVLDQRWVVQLTCLLNFGLTELDEFLVEVGLVLLEDLEGDLAAVSLVAFLDLSTEARAQSTPDGVVVNSCSHSANANV